MIMDMTVGCIKYFVYIYIITVAIYTGKVSVTIVEAVKNVAIVIVIIIV